MELESASWFIEQIENGDISQQIVKTYHKKTGLNGINEVYKKIFHGVIAELLFLIKIVSIAGFFIGLFFFDKPSSLKYAIVAGVLLVVIQLLQSHFDKERKGSTELVDDYFMLEWSLNLKLLTENATPLEAKADSVLFDHADKIKKLQRQEAMTALGNIERIEELRKIFKQKHALFFKYNLVTDEKWNRWFDEQPASSVEVSEKNETQS